MQQSLLYLALIFFVTSFWQHLPDIILFTLFKNTHNVNWPFIRHCLVYCIQLSTFLTCGTCKTAKIGEEGLLKKAYTEIFSRHVVFTLITIFARSCESVKCE